MRAWLSSRGGRVVAPSEVPQQQLRPLRPEQLAQPEAGQLAQPPYNPYGHSAQPAGVAMALGSYSGFTGPIMSGQK